MRTISLERLQILDTATARTSLCQMSVGQEMRASPPGAPLPVAMAGSGGGWQKISMRGISQLASKKVWVLQEMGRALTPCLLQCAGGLETIPKWWPTQRQR